jgi:hypothetical protein
MNTAETETVNNTDNNTEQDHNIILTDKLAKRRLYLRNYYLKNKEKAQAYQRMYNLKYKKKFKKTDFDDVGRSEIREVFNICDIMKASPEKTAIIINQIVDGKRSLTLNI